MIKIYQKYHTGASTVVTRRNPLHESGLKSRRHQYGVLPPSLTPFYKVFVRPHTGLVIRWQTIALKRFVFVYTVFPLVVAIPGLPELIFVTVIFRPWVNKNQSIYQLWTDSAINSDWGSFFDHGATTNIWSFLPTFAKLFVALLLIIRQSPFLIFSLNISV